jgi:WD40 repeat-containing protein SMU1
MDKIDSKEVLQYILQFLKENKLNHSFHEMVKETNVEYNFLNSTQEYNELENEILNGNWDKVLKILSFITLSKNALIELHKFIILELLEFGEVEVSKLFLLQSSILKENTQQYQEVLEYFNLNFKKKEKEEIQKSRENLWKSVISKEIKILNSSQLLMRLSHQNMSQVKELVNQESHLEVSNHSGNFSLDKKIKFGKKSYPICSIVSPNGEYLVSGSVDNFIEGKFIQNKFISSLGYEHWKIESKFRISKK